MDSALYPVRSVGASEYPAVSAVIDEAFGRESTAEEWDKERLVLDLDRTLAAVDGTRIVGTAASYDLQMAVPGGRRPVAGVTWIGVLPTHHRRGILRSLILRQLADLHDNGEAVAALWASEAAIYGRYGYGCATRHASFTVHRGEAAYVPAAPDDPALRLRITAPQEAQPHLAKLYDAQVEERPGTLVRDTAWWDKRLFDPPRLREGHGRLRCLLAEDDTGPRGYALFSLHSSFDGGYLPSGELMLKELVAADPAAYAAAWRHVLDRDLVATVRVPSRPVDDPVWHLIADPRRLRPLVTDQLWLRLVDVGPALSGRAYAVPVDVVVGVTDRTCPWNEGRWHLTGDMTGGTCERTDRPADVIMPVSVLGAGYLGGTGLTGFARAGLVREQRAGALSALSHALGWDPLPWCPMVF